MECYFSILLSTSVEHGLFDHFWWLIFVIWFKLKSRFQCRQLNRPVDIILTGCECLNCTRNSQFSLEHCTNTIYTSNEAFQSHVCWLTDYDDEVGRSMSIHYKCILCEMDGVNPSKMKLFRQVSRIKKNWPE